SLAAPLCLALAFTTTSTTPASPTATRTTAAVLAACVDRHSRRQLVQLRGREHFTALETFNDLPLFAFVRTERTDLLPRLAVLDHVHRRHAGERRHSVIGYDHHVVVDFERDRAFREETGFQYAVGVVDERLDGERSRRLIHRRTHVGDFARERAVRERLNGELHVLSLADHSGEFFLDGCPELQRVHLDDRDNLGVFADVFTRLHQ